MSEITTENPSSGTMYLADGQPVAFVPTERAADQYYPGFDWEDDFTYSDEVSRAGKPPCFPLFFASHEAAEKYAKTCADPDAKAAKDEHEAAEADCRRMCRENITRREARADDIASAAARGVILDDDDDEDDD